MTARFVEFRDAVVRKIKEALPDLKSCEVQTGRFNLDDLKTERVRTPGVRFAVLKAPIQNEPNASQTALCECAAFVIDDKRDRDTATWTIAEAITALAHSGQQWGLTKIGVPTAVNVAPVVTLGIEKRTTAILAVTWKQRLLGIGATLFEPGEPFVPAELYIGDELVPLEDVVDA